MRLDTISNKKTYKNPLFKIISIHKLTECAEGKVISKVTFL